MSEKKLAFVAGQSPSAQEALKILQDMYPHVSPEESDVIVTLGGDGALLRTLHSFLHLKKPVFGMNRGSVGFLMNEFRPEGLHQRLDKAESVELHPLKMEALCGGGMVKEALAFNEVSLFRQTGQAAHLRVSINDIVRLEEMVCDGVLVATTAGSTAYNNSAYGPILPLGSGVLAITAISAYRPRRWRGAILPHTSVVEIEVLDHERRPVGTSADSAEIRDVLKVKIYEDRTLYSQVMYDPEHKLDERIIREQFTGG